MSYKYTRLTFTTGNLGGNRVTNHVMHVIDELNSVLDSEIAMYKERLDNWKPSLPDGVYSDEEFKYLTCLEVAELHKLKWKLREAIWEDVVSDPLDPD